ncbi:MAG: GGDEF domain-containing protein [Gammaproteobacteria bacterium]|nr:GGDEF domain-containing protein [Gammaproteobacteria bacterium]
MGMNGRILTSLAELWSLTKFNGAELTDYAESMMFQDTRKGIIILGMVSMFLLAASAVVYFLLGYDTLYIYSCSVLAALAFHVSVSARSIHEINVLYLLGMTLLVVNGVAFVLLAHHTGTFNAALFASVILLFLLMPLVPWGLREAMLIVLLVYSVFTFSTLSVAGRFSHETLWMLQFAMIAAGGTTLIVIGRSIVVRRDDIQARFELVKAHDHMAMLSLKDPLTGAWNRRFMEENFSGIKASYQQAGCGMRLAQIDIDDFKVLNDSRGHHYGDLVLRRLVANFLELFSAREHLIRMGGDEFMLLMPDDASVDLIEQGARALRSDAQLFSASADSQVNISVGLLSIPVNTEVSLQDAYRAVDKVLYQAKASKGEASQQCSLVATVLES